MADHGVAQVIHAIEQSNERLEKLREAVLQMVDDMAAVGLDADVEEVLVDAVRQCCGRGLVELCRALERPRGMPPWTPWFRDAEIVTPDEPYKVPPPAHSGQAASTSRKRSSVVGGGTAGEGRGGARPRGVTAASSSPPRASNASEAMDVEGMGQEAGGDGGSSALQHLLVSLGSPPTDQDVQALVSILGEWSSATEGGLAPVRVLTGAVGRLLASTSGWDRNFKLRKVADGLMAIAARFKAFEQYGEELEMLQGLASTVAGGIEQQGGGHRLFRWTPLSEQLPCWEQEGPEEQLWRAMRFLERADQNFHSDLPGQDKFFNLLMRLEAQESMVQQVQAEALRQVRLAEERRGVFGDNDAVELEVQVWQAVHGLLSSRLVRLQQDGMRLESAARMSCQAYEGLIRAWASAMGSEAKDFFDMERQLQLVVLEQKDAAESLKELLKPSKYA